MITIKFKNYGVSSNEIGDLMGQFDGKPSTDENIEKLKEIMDDRYIEHPFIQVDTTGDSFAIFDTHTQTNCEVLLYN